MIITHLVFLPQVQSIARPLSFASCMSLLAGEESEFTTAITLSAFIILLKPTFTNFISSPELLDILNLLADLFKLCLHIHNQMCDFSVACLGADSIDLAVDLLNKEVQLSA